MSDILKEIESEIKSERYQRFFLENGVKLIVGAVLIIIITAAYTIFNNMEKAKAEKLGKGLVKALADSKAEKYDAALEKEHKGYTPIARLSKAAVLKVDEKYDAAIAELKKVSEGKYDRGFVEISKINQAFLLIKNNGDEKTILNLLEETSQKDSVFKFTAMELKADYLVSRNRNDEAKKIFREISTAEGVPDTMKARAVSTLAILN
jgi:hypothetical protein